MMKTIIYPRVPEGQCLGRNRFMQTGGIEVMDGDFGREVWLYPMTSKPTGSNACKIVIPTEAIPEVVGALTSFTPPATWDPTPVAPGRLARLVAKWRGGPYPAIG